MKFLKFIGKCLEWLLIIICILAIAVVILDVTLPYIITGLLEGCNLFYEILNHFIT